MQSNDSIYNNKIIKKNKHNEAWKRMKLIRISIDFSIPFQRWSISGHLRDFQRIRTYRPFLFLVSLLFYETVSKYDDLEFHWGEFFWKRVTAQIPLCFDQNISDEIGMDEFESLFVLRVFLVWHFVFSLYFIFLLLLYNYDFGFPNSRIPFIMIIWLFTWHEIEKSWIYSILGLFLHSLLSTSNHVFSHCFPLRVEWM